MENSFYFKLLHDAAFSKRVLSLLLTVYCNGVNGGGQGGGLWSERRCCPPILTLWLPPRLLPGARHWCCRPALTWWSWVTLHLTPGKEPQWEVLLGSLPALVSLEMPSPLVLQLCLCLAMCLPIQTLTHWLCLLAADLSGNHGTPGCSRLGSRNLLCSPCTGPVGLPRAHEDTVLDCLLPPSAPGSLSPVKQPALVAPRHSSDLQIVPWGCQQKSNSGLYFGSLNGENPCPFIFHVIYSHFWFSTWLEA